MKILVSALFTLALTGCAAPYSEFYRDSTGGVGVVNNPRFVPYNGDPVVQRGGVPLEDLVRMRENGFDKIGESSFNAGKVNENGAVVQAKKVNAAVVLLYSRYTNTVSGAMPMVTPTTSTSNTYVNGNSYGRPFSGVAQTTTYGTQTTYVPYSVDRSDHLAVYYSKTKPPRLGIYVDEIKGEMRREIGTNKGVMISAVVKDSPAFYSDIFKGDILTAINQSPIYSAQQFMDIARAQTGEKISMELLREGKIITKNVALK